jgi:hypothetical protein
LVESLKHLDDGFLRDIDDDLGPDVRHWNDILRSIPESQRNWLDAPWLIGEFYFYRRVIEAFGYFKTAYDPFARTKQDGLLSSIRAIGEICSIWNHHNSLESNSQILQFGIYTALWGNKKDLSLWPSEFVSIDSRYDAVETPSLRDALKVLTELGNSRILHDMSISVIEKLLSCNEGPRKYGIIVDNAGFELFSDLFFGLLLVEAGVANAVEFYTKGYPTFVSDATSRDCEETLDILTMIGTSVSPIDLETNGVPRTIEIHGHADVGIVASRIKELVRMGKISFVSDCFWCSCASFSDMPDDLAARILESNVTFVKGDANYRRLINDREYPFETPIEDAFSFCKGSICALRTLKSEVCVGLSEFSIQRAEAEDALWRVNGEWGVIQFLKL